MRKDLEYKVWFASLKLSNKMKIILLEKMDKEKDIYINRKELSTLKGMKKLNVSLDNEITERILRDINNNKYNLITFNELEYPSKLKVIENSPYGIFIKGDIRPLMEGPSLAIVGSRDCTQYGVEVTKHICNELSKVGMNIVSGGALGIDTIAHKTCCNNNSYNVAILGCGINIYYPAYNKGLYNLIEQNGAIISEFLPDTKPFHYNFPLRNRIISGLCKGVIVIEAGEKSGSLITCTCALEQGKDVVAVPGPIFSPKSKGCNKLIKDGAYIFTTIEELLYNFSINCNTEKVKIYNGLKQNILELLEEKIMHIDEIVRITNIDISVINTVLCELQFDDNEINNIYGNYYAKIL